MVGTIKNAASRASGPAAVVAAGVVGVAGGLVLKRLPRRKKVLGVPLPRSIGKAGLPDLDPSSIAKAVGKASKQVGKTSKDVSRDIERVGDQAERIGKILG